jgi:hypothetical protein
LFFGPTILSADPCNAACQRVTHGCSPADADHGHSRILRPAGVPHTRRQRFTNGDTMHKLGPISAAIASSLLLAALASADTAPTANKWRIELDGQALSSGDLQFRVTPRQGDAVEVVASIRSGRAENNVAKDVRDAFAAKLSPERYTVEVDDGEDILIKKKDGQPDFALELLDSNVRNVNIKVEGE